MGIFMLAAEKRIVSNNSMVSSIFVVFSIPTPEIFGILLHPGSHKLLFSEEGIDFIYLSNTILLSSGVDTSSYQL
jgi:hypothetical protein